MSIIVTTKCKNCEYCLKTKTICGPKYICKKLNKKVYAGYYCGKMQPFKTKEN